MMTFRNTGLLLLALLVLLALEWLFIPPKAAGDRNRMTAAHKISALFAADRPWSSGLLIMVTAGVTVFGVHQAYILIRGPGSGFVHDRVVPSPGSMLVFAALSTTLLFGLSTRFSRTTLRRVTFLLLSLGAAAVIGLGQMQLDVEASALGAEAHTALQSRLETLTIEDDQRVAGLLSALAGLRESIFRSFEPARRDRLVNLLDQLVQDTNSSRQRIPGPSHVEAVLAELKTGPISTEQLAILDDVLRTSVSLAQERAESEESVVASARRKLAALRITVDACVQQLPCRDGYRSRLERRLAVAGEAVAQVSASLGSGVSAERNSSSVPVTVVGGPASALELFSAGGRSLVNRLWSRQSEPIMEFDYISWVALALLAIAYFRFLERRCAKGELLVSSVTNAGDDNDKDSEQRFRAYLSRNIPEPSVVPGGPTNLAPITDLLTLGNPVAKVALPKLFESIGQSLRSPRGASIGFSCLELAERTGNDVDEVARNELSRDERDSGALLAKYRTAVRVSPPGSRMQIHRAFERTSKEESLRSGAFWAAVVLMNRSRRVPDWASWSEDSTDSLAAYYDHDELLNHGPPEKLEEAVRLSPRSGLLLTQLAHVRALNGDLIGSFSLLVRAVYLYPRWPVASYRAGVTAVMLAAEAAATWVQAPEAVRQSIVAVLIQDRRRRVRSAAERLAGAGTDGVQARVALCQLGEARLRPFGMVGLPKVISGLLRSSERAFWLSLIESRDHVSFRQQFRLLAKSARLLALTRLAPLGPSASALLKTSELPFATWKLSYNLACVYAEKVRHFRPDGADAARNKAVELLELAAIRPGDQQLTRDWLLSDPDLRSIAQHERFQRLAEQLAGSKQAEDS